ncbi:MAG: hypothetical protein IT328_00050 [Caldilineaceae bacterium]|nr:hypothetical protein [Caldilineaceae bacterium]
MSRIAFSYEIPFVDSVTMPERWARWLAAQGSRPNTQLGHAPVVDGNITWRFQEHGLMPWMQFFYDWRFADLTGDGKIDFLLTSSAQRQTAYRQDGTILWQYEDPDASFMDIRLDTNFPLLDLNGDGVTELVCARMIDGALHLCIVNARTGELIQSIPYPNLADRPNDKRGSITIANVSGNQTASDIVVGWDYASLTVFDRNLKLLWQRNLASEAGRNHRTMGHTPFCADVDGDGHDEILAGSCLLDHDGTVLWVAPDLPALVKDTHADSVQVAYLDDDTGSPYIVMSTGAYCFSLDGKLLWGRDDLKHGQALRVGKLRADVLGKQVVVYEGASRVDKSLPDKVVTLDKDGNLLWEMEIIQPDVQEGGFGFWLGDWDGDGFDEIFVNDQEKVNILNGAGKLIDTIPGHLIYVFDLVGDQRAEAVILTGIEPGMQMQIITNDQPNPNPATNAVIDQRAATKSMINATRY